MVSDALDHQVRPTRAEIDLDALAHNLGLARASAGPASVYGVVKADAYGHGLVPVSRRLLREGVGGLCVALVEEGIALREAGLEAPILVLNGIYDGAHAAVLEADLTPVVYELSDVRRFAEVAGGRPVPLHVKVDTGMTRLGVRMSALDRFLDGVAAAGLPIAGLMTHLSSSEDDPEATREQLAIFAEAEARVRGRGHAPVRHLANSGAIFLRPRAHADAVRAGVALYGVRPTLGSTLDLRPVMRLVTSVARVAEVPAGTAVGYGDGLMRHLSNRGAALIGGRRCPIVGRVSMDLTGVDVTELGRCARGDEAVLFGAQGGEVLRPEEVAEAAGTIAYEVLTSVSPRVPRIYLGES